MNQWMVSEHTARDADVTPSSNLSAKCPHAGHGGEACLRMPSDVTWAGVTQRWQQFPEQSAHLYTLNCHPSHGVRRMAEPLSLHSSCLSSKCTSHHSQGRLEYFWQIHSSVWTLQGLPLWHMSLIAEVPNLQLWGFPHSSVGKESACNAGDPGSILGKGRYPWRRDRLPTPVFLGFPCGSAGKEFGCNAGDLGSIPGLRRSPGEGKGYPLQYPGLENFMDCIAHGVAKSRTWLSNLHFHFLRNLQAMDKYLLSDQWQH